MPKRKITSEERLVLAIDITETLAVSKDGSMSVDELCHRFDIDRSTLEGIAAIIATLADRESGARAVCTIEDDTITLGGEGATLLPLRLTAAEGAVLDRVLESLGLDGACAERIRRALLPRELGYSYHVETTAARGGFWKPLSEAIEDGVRVRLGYRTLGEDSARMRTVDPLRIMNERGNVYLVGWDVERDAQRTYRLDRIASVELTEDSIVHHEEAGATVKDSLRTGGRSVRLSMPSKRAARLTWPGIACVQEEGERSVVTVHVGSTRWLLSQVLAGGGEIVILDDPALIRELAAFARELTGGAMRV